MRFSEADQALFESILNKFISRHGRDVLVDVYNLHRELINRLCLKHFPINEINNFLLFENIKRNIKKGLSINAIAEEIIKRHRISKRNVYYFYHTYYKTRIKIKKDGDVKLTYTHRHYSKTTETHLQQIGISEETPPAEVISQLLGMLQCNKGKQRNTDQKKAPAKKPEQMLINF